MLVHSKQCTRFVGGGVPDAPFCHKTRIMWDVEDAVPYTDLSNLIIN